MRLILQTLLIILIIATFSICAIQPDLHKNVIVYDSAYTLVPEQEVKTETKDIPVMEMPARPIEKTTVVEKKVEPVVTKTKMQTATVQKQTVKTPKQNTVKTQTVTKPKVETVSKPAVAVVQKPLIKETVKRIILREIDLQSVIEG